MTINQNPQAALRNKYKAGLEKILIKKSEGSKAHRQYMRNFLIKLVGKAAYDHDINKARNEMLFTFKDGVYERMGEKHYLEFLVSMALGYMKPAFCESMSRTENPIGMIERKMGSPLPTKFSHIFNQA